jgi:protein SCO1/2
MRTICTALFLALLGCAAAAQVVSPGSNVEKQIGIDQKMGSQLPLNTPFLDENGEAVTLQKYFTGKPVVMNLIFYNCAGTCTMVLDGMIAGFKKTTDVQIGRDFEVVTVSIHPKETPELARNKKAAYMKMLAANHNPNGWHFLTGRWESIQAVAKALGFRFTYDPVSDIISHPAGIMILAPNGQVSRYITGITYPGERITEAVKAAQTGVIAAAEKKPILFGCLVFDPARGRYSLQILGVIKVAGVLTALGLAVAILRMVRRETHSVGRAGLA